MSTLRQSYGVSAWITVLFITQLKYFVEICISICCHRDCIQVETFHERKLHGEWTLLSVLPREVKFHFCNSKVTTARLSPLSTTQLSVVQVEEKTRWLAKAERHENSFSNRIRGGGPWIVAARCHAEATLVAIQYLPSFSCSLNAFFTTWYPASKQYLKPRLEVVLVQTL